MVKCCGADVGLICDDTAHHPGGLLGSALPVS